MKGYIQVYTGDGKGKTTAVLGLCLRAAGAGLRVFILQFMKKGGYSEIKALERFAAQITVEQYGTGRFVKGQPDEAEHQAGQEALKRLEAVLLSGEYDLVVADEANVAAKCGVIPVESLLGLMRRKPAAVELVLTGRGADPRVIEAADLVTEMKEIKHYYRKKGVKSRIGIER